MMTIIDTDASAHVPLALYPPLLADVQGYLMQFSGTLPVEIPQNVLVVDTRPYAVGAPVWMVDGTPGRITYVSDDGRYRVEWRELVCGETRFKCVRWCTARELDQWGAKASALVSTYKKAAGE